MKVLQGVSTCPRTCSVGQGVGTGRLDVVRRGLHEFLQAAVPLDQGLPAPAALSDARPEQNTNNSRRAGWTTTGGRRAGGRAASWWLRVRGESGCFSTAKLSWGHPRRSSLPWRAARESNTGACGDNGNTSGKLDWTTPMFPGTVLQKAPNAS
jgi:hypothetical protein